MRRRWRHIGAETPIGIGWLGLGAVVSVLVAWACAVWSPAGDESRVSDASRLSWVVAPPSGWPDRPAYELCSGGLGVSERWQQDQSIYVGDSDALRVNEQATLAAGWPFRCVVAHQHRVNLKDYDVFGLRLFGHAPSIAEGVPLPSGIATMYTCVGRVLPVEPLWMGLALDAGVWGGALLLLCCIYGKLRHVCRRLRRRCAGCGYPCQAGASRCPECGCNVARA